MDRRELLGAFGAAAAGMMATGAFAAAADEDKDKGHEHHDHMDKVHETCLHNCLSCAMACNMLSHHCMHQITAGNGDLKQHARVHSLAMDCQAFCALSATMMARSSDLMEHSCAACAEACNACATECEKAGGDPVHKEVAGKLRDCEKSCHEMVNHMKKSSTEHTD